MTRLLSRPALLGLLALLPLPLAAQESADGPAPTLTQLGPVDALPFESGEVLYFDLYWSIFKVATAEVSIELVDREGGEAWHMQMTVETRGFVDAFYRVRDSIESWIDPGFTRSLHYIKDQQEGDHERYVVIDFDWPAMQATYSNFGEALEPIALEAPAFDPFSVLYAARGRPDLLTSETDFILPLTDGKRYLAMPVHVEDGGTHPSPLGEVETIRVVPTMEGVRGVFEQKKGSSLHLWFMREPPHLPVRMQSEVAVGSFTGKLVRVELPGGKSYEVEREERPTRRGRR